MAATRTGTGTLTALIALLGIVFAGCADPPVGDPCVPDEIPEDGFVRQEAYIETSSVQCLTRVCLVYHYEGDPSHPPADAFDAQEREDRMYCTCRCKADDPRFTTCKCPDGYTCTEVLQKGGPGLRGSYCVKSGVER